MRRRPPSIPPPQKAARQAGLSYVSDEIMPGIRRKGAPGRFSYVGPGGKGKSIANLVSMEEGERIAAMLAVKEFEDDKFVVMGTRKGVVKKTALSAARKREWGH